MSATRRARLRALAKINLDLRVLGKRPDGYHELRTIFQTISLADYASTSPSRRRAGPPSNWWTICHLADNLATRAARAWRWMPCALTGRVEMRLTKRIPMGAGLGGGSSDAAAVLLALPVLAGRSLTDGRLCHLGEQLGSDVPFFLLGGTAVGIGPRHGAVPAARWRPRGRACWWPPGMHVSTRRGIPPAEPAFDKRISTK